MQRILLFFLLILSTLCYAQKPQKPKVFKANMKRFQMPEAGVWEFYDDDGKLEQRYDFTNNLLLSEAKPAQIDTGKSKVLNGHDTVLTILESRPVVIGGFHLFYRWLGANYRFPREVLEGGKSGKLLVKFIISEDGRAKNPVVVQHIGYGSAEAMIELINKMPFKWIPGKAAGKNVNVVFSLPFMLQVGSS